MDKMFDVIVVGAGNGGLAAAANTAKEGLNTLLLEKHISDRECLVNDENIRVEHNLDCKRQSYHHSAGIGFYRLVYKITDIGKLNDFLIFRFDISIGKTEYSGVHPNIVTSGKLRIESAAKFEQGGYSAVGFDSSRSRL